MTFDSTRMRENPGDVFPVVFEDGEIGEAQMPTIYQGEIVARSGTVKWSYHSPDGSLIRCSGHYSAHDIVAYAPRAEERWKRIYDDGTLGTCDYTAREVIEGGSENFVRVRITVIDEGAA